MLLTDTTNEYYRMTRVVYYVTYQVKWLLTIFSSYASASLYPDTVTLMALCHHIGSLPD